MIPIVVLAQNNPRRLIKLISGALEKYGEVILRDADTVRQLGAGVYDFSLEHTTRLTEFYASGGILLLHSPSVSAGRPGMSKGIVPVLESGNRRAERMVRGILNAALCCGMSGRDTLTLSSIGDMGAVATVQRSITSLSGDIIEPCDIPVTLTKPCDKQDLLFTVAVLLLCGCLPQDGELLI